MKMKIPTLALVWGILCLLTGTGAQHLDPINNMCIRFDHQCKITAGAFPYILACAYSRQPSSKTIRFMSMVGDRHLSIPAGVEAIGNKLAILRKATVRNHQES